MMRAWICRKISHISPVIRIRKFQSGLKSSPNKLKSIQAQFRRLLKLENMNGFYLVLLIE